VEVIVMKVSEKRTQVYFPEETYQKILRKARLESKSAAAIIREAVNKYVEEEDIDWENDPLWKTVGIMNSKKGDISRNHDRYIYGDKKKK
jgi:predicted DNA-binding protein